MRRVRFVRVGMSPALGSQAGTKWFHCGFAEGGFPCVRWIFEDAPDGRAIPPRFPGAGLFSGLMQAALDLANGAPISSHPLTDLTHSACFCPPDLEASLSRPIPLAHIPVALGRTREPAHGSSLGRLSFPSWAALQDCCPLLLGTHALDWQQELIFRRLPHFSVEEQDCDSCAKQLFAQEHLMGRVACEAIGAMHLKVINAPCCSDIAEAFQCRTDECRAAVAIVHKRLLWCQRQSWCRDACAEVSDLALDGVRLVVLFRRATSIHGNLDGIHWAFLAAPGALGTR